MARVKYGAIVTEINGKVGGSVFQRNAYGHSLKNTPSVRSLNTQSQQIRKISMQSRSKSWSTFSQSDRDSWVAYAQTFPIPSRLNPDSNLNGYNYYLKYNLLSLMIGEVVPLSDPGVTSASFLINAVNLTRLSDTEMTLSANYDCSTEDHFMIAMLTTGFNESRKIPRFTPRFIDFKDQSGGFPPTFFYTQDVGLSYIDVFTALPILGSFVGVKLWLIGTLTGFVIEVPTLNVEVKDPL